MVRVSPGSPSKWMATRSPWPASTCRSTQLYATLSLPPTNHFANGGFDQSSVSVEVGGPGQQRRACSAQKPEPVGVGGGVEIGRAVGLRRELLAGRELAVLVGQVRQGLVRHSVLQFGQQHVRASLNPLRAPASRRAARITAGGRAVRANGRAARGAHGSAGRPVRRSVPTRVSPQSAESRQQVPDAFERLDFVLT